MKRITILVGPPASGKSTLSKQYVDEGYVRVNTDDQGKQGQRQVFEKAVADGADIIVDRMNFDKKQRNNYLSLTKPNGYTSEIIVLHESFAVCLERARRRENHPTVKDEETARKALDFFFKSYERPTPDEADKIEFRYPEGPKRKALICDLDGTLADCSHRQHFVRKAVGEKKDWRGFFMGMAEDKLIMPVYDILFRFQAKSCDDSAIVFCSGRPDDYKKVTKEWLAKTGLIYDDLVMRPRGDQRQDSIVKEVLLDFEILTKYEPYFILDDRDQVVEMWRSRGLQCLQVAKGDF